MTLPVSRHHALARSSREGLRILGCIGSLLYERFRLALIDNMYAEEKPFLILDDPFVNLDDAHTERALKLVERIAGEYQVLYLVCNSSRSGYSR